MPSLLEMLSNVLSPHHDDFDPEGDGYDYTTAEKYGLGPDESGHYPSRVPETGQLLKGKKHPTFHLTQKEEKKLGNIIFKGKDGFYYSLSKDESKRLGFAEGYEVDVPYTKDDPEERINPFTGEPYTALYYRGDAVRKRYDEGGSDRKKVSDMERLGFAKAGKLDIVKEAFLTKKVEDILTKSVRDQEGYKFQLELEDDGESTILRNKKHRQFVRDMFIALKEKGHPFPEAAATHAGYESRFGASDLAQETNNVFGLKKSTKVDEPYKEYDTREEAEDGSSYIEKKAKFRTFNTIGDSIDGYMEHINNRGLTAPHSEKTPKQWRSATTDREYFDAIQKDGYATKGAYAESLENNLNDYKSRGVFDLTNPPPPL